MKKIFFCLLAIIILCLVIIGIEGHKQNEIKKYHISIKACAEKESFYLTDVTDFDWDKAVAFEFPADLKEFEEMAGIKINFNYDLSEGIIFINRGKIVFKDITEKNPEVPSSISYELNNKHLSVFEKNTLVYVEKYDDVFYVVKKQNE